MCVFQKKNVFVRKLHLFIKFGYNICPNKKLLQVPILFKVLNLFVSESVLIPDLC